MRFLRLLSSKGLSELFSGWILPLAALSLTIVIGVDWSLGTKFWYDEIITWRLATTDSLSYSLEALYHHADGNSPVYVVFIWLWARVFGDSELALRAPSMLASALSMFLIYRYLLSSKRIPSLLLIGAAFPFTLLGNLFAQYVMEARPYSFLVFGTVLVYMVPWLVRVSVSRSLAFIWSFFAFFLVVHSQALGILHAASLFTGLLMVRMFRREGALQHARAMISGAFLGVCSWLLWLPFFLQQRRLNDPESWVKDVSFSNGVDYLFIPERKDAVFFVLLVAFIWYLNRFFRSDARLDTGNESAAIQKEIVEDWAIISFVASLTPFGFFVLQAFGIPLLVPRYLITQHLHLLILVLTVPILSFRFYERKLPSSVSTVVSLVLIVSCVVSARNWSTTDNHRLKLAIECEEVKPFVPQGEQMLLIIESELIYEQLQHYWECGEQVRLIYPVDFEVSLQGTKIERSRIPGFRLAEAHEKYFPTGDRIETKELLKSIPDRFLMIDSAGIPWAERYLLEKGYEKELLLPLPEKSQYLMHETSLSLFQLSPVGDDMIGMSEKENHYNEHEVPRRTGPANKSCGASCYEGGVEEVGKENAKWDNN